MDGPKRFRYSINSTDTSGPTTHTHMKRTLRQRSSPWPSNAQFSDQEAVPSKSGPARAAHAIAFRAFVLLFPARARCASLVGKNNTIKNDHRQIIVAVFGRCTGCRVTDPNRNVFILSVHYCGVQIKKMPVHVRPATRRANKIIVQYTNPSACFDHSSQSPVAPVV